MWNLNDLVSLNKMSETPMLFRYISDVLDLWDLDVFNFFFSLKWLVMRIAKFQEHLIYFLIFIGIFTMFWTDLSKSFFESAHIQKHQDWKKHINFWSL